MNRKINLSLCAIASVAVVPTFVQAQAMSAYEPGIVRGFSISETLLSLQLGLMEDAAISYDNGVTYTGVTDVFSLGRGSRSLILGALAQDQHGYEYRPHTGGGGSAYPWFTNPGESNGINPGESLTFMYDWFPENTSYELIIHYLDEFGATRFASITPVPEPATISVFGMGMTLLVLAKYRRRKG